MKEGGHMTEQAADHAPVQRGERGRYWDRWLEELRALPVEAPEWDGVAAFVAALQQLTEIKWQERDSRSRLQQTLARLVTKCGDELTFFGLIDVTSWTAKTCLLAEVLTLAAQVEQFQAVLLRYRDLRRQPTANAAEGRQRRKALDELDEQITQQHSRLAAVLLPSASAPLPQQEQSPAPRKEPTPSEEGVPVDLSSPPQPLDTAPASLESGVLLTPTENTRPAAEVSLLEPAQPLAGQVSALNVTNGAGPVAAEEPATAAILPLELRSPQEAAVPCNATTAMRIGTPCSGLAFPRTTYRWPTGWRDPCKPVNAPVLCRIGCLPQGKERVGCRHTRRILYAALQQVQAELAAARQKRLETLRTDWQNLHTRLAEAIAPTKWERIAAFI